MILFQISVLFIGIVSSVTCHKPAFRNAKSLSDFSTVIHENPHLKPVHEYEVESEEADAEIWDGEPDDPWAPKIVQIEVSHEVKYKPKIESDDGWVPVVPSWTLPKTKTVGIWKAGDPIPEDNADWISPTKVYDYSKWKAPPKKVPSYLWKEPKKELWKAYKPQSWSHIKTPVVTQSIWTPHEKPTVYLPKGEWKAVPTIGWKPEPTIGWKPEPTVGWKPEPTIGWKPEPTWKPAPTWAPKPTYGWKITAEPTPAAWKPEPTSGWKIGPTVAWKAEPTIGWKPAPTSASLTHWSSFTDKHHWTPTSDGKHKDKDYNFNYGVDSSKTGDVKTHEESKKGDVVQGKYTVKEADGSTREVHYTAGKHSGFNAVVLNHSTHSGHKRQDKS